MAGLLGNDASLDPGGTSAILQGRLEESDSSTNWYFPREELEKTSPSLRDGIDGRRETYFRKSYCTFLQDLGMRLKVPQVTIATAITFCHRFYLRQSHAKNDRFMIATVCMFLAGKVEETPRVLKDVIIVSYTIRNKKDPSAVNRIKQKEMYEAQKELVLYGERLVLTILGFDLNVHHPYRPLVAAIKKFNVSQHALAQVAWNFVNDGLRTSLCLQFKPHHIAAGAIFLAAKFLKVKLPHEGERPWWQEFDVTPRQLEEVSNQMLELYEQNRAAPTLNTDDPGCESAVGVNGHHLAGSLPSSTSEGRRDSELEAPPRDNGSLATSSELERPPQPRSQNQRSESVDRRRGSEQPTSEITQKQRSEDEQQQQQLQQQQFQLQQLQQQQLHHRDVENASEAADRVDRTQQQEGKRKREASSEKKWSSSSSKDKAAEEGELPPPPPTRSDDHYHSSSRGGSGAEKRYDDRDHGGGRSRDSGQDYRHHSDHHSSYHYQSDRSRTHSKDRDWQERDPKKSRHKYS